MSGRVVEGELACIVCYLNSLFEASSLLTLHCSGNNHARLQLGDTKTPGVTARLSEELPSHHCCFGLYHGVKLT